jgi:hypothetical protein
MALPYVPMYEFKAGHNVADAMRRRDEQRTGFQHDQMLQGERIGAEDRRFDQSHRLDRERLDTQRQQFGQEHALAENKFSFEQDTNRRDFGQRREEWEKAGLPGSQAQIRAWDAQGAAARAGAAGTYANIDHAKWVRDQTIAEHLRGQQEGFSAQKLRILHSGFNPVVTRQGGDITSLSHSGRASDGDQWVRNVATQLMPELLSSRGEFYRNDHNLPMLQKLVSDMRERATTPEARKIASDFDAFVNDYIRTAPFGSRNEGHTSRSTIPRQGAPRQQGNTDYSNPLY